MHVLTALLALSLNECVRRWFLHIIHGWLFPAAGLTNFNQGSVRDLTAANDVVDGRSSVVVKFLSCVFCLDFVSTPAKDQARVLHVTLSPKWSSPVDILVGYGLFLDSGRPAWACTGVLS